MIARTYILPNKVRYLGPLTQEEISILSGLLWSELLQQPTGNNVDKKGCHEKLKTQVFEDFVRNKVYTYISYKSTGYAQVMETNVLLRKHSFGWIFRSAKSINIPCIITRRRMCILHERISYAPFRKTWILIPSWGGQSQASGRRPQGGFFDFRLVWPIVLGVISRP
jgi:hypothetical protein